MIPIIICEDILEQRKHTENIILNHIVMEDYRMNIVLSTNSPDDVMAYLSAHPNQNGLYFLDINLEHMMSGLSLATHIREKDPQSTIIFVTQHVELSPLTFKYKVEALDYIVKDDTKNFANNLISCIDTTHARYATNKLSNTKGFNVKDGTLTRLIPFEDIMFFTTDTTPHKIILHLNKSHINFYGNIKTLDEISPDFFRCHKSFVVNLRNIKHVDHKDKTIMMVNDEVALVTTKKLKALTTAMKARNLTW
jgi:two-component system response regulator AgrA